MQFLMTFLTILAFLTNWLLPSARALGFRCKNDFSRRRTIIISNNNSTRIKRASSVIAYCRGGGGVSPQNDNYNNNSQNNNNEGIATISDEILNLVKSIIGAGIFSLPAGIASFGNAPSAIVPSIFLICIMGTISAYTFAMIARVCRLSGATSYADAWDKTMGKKKNTAWIVAASSTLDCFAGTLTYSMILADAVRDLLKAVGIITTRSRALLCLTILVLLPLCLIQNLASLAPFSFVGIMGMAYTSIVIAVRYFDGSYADATSITPLRKFIPDLAPHLRPNFGSKGAMRALTSPSTLILISMLSTAYIAHFNAPKFYRELKNNTLKRFNTVVSTSFGISIALYAIVSSLAFLTFGGACSGLILNNYSTNDQLISLSRFAIAISLISSYPLLFVGLRDGLFDLLRLEESSINNINHTRYRYVLSTIGLLGIITALAFKITDLTFVASMSGAVLGTSLIFIYPTLMFRAAVRNDPTKQWERRLCSVIASLGVAIGIVGAKMAIEKTFIK